MRVFVACSILIGWAGVSLGCVPDADIAFGSCENNDSRCLGRDFFCPSMCDSFVYEKRTAWFGLVNRWYVHSRAGGPTLSLSEFVDYITADSNEADIWFGSRFESLKLIGENKLNACHVNSFRECLYGQHGGIGDERACRAMTIEQIDEWKRSIDMADALFEDGE